ncbi:MAG: YIP1 family protein [Caldilineaceae bacterium]|nr:YIP1 family protein [Caldilineaceae bacterium]
MTDDDNPWVEGLFFTAVIGFVIAIGQIIGGFFLTATLPAPAALLEAILQVVRQMRPAGFTAPELLAVESAIRQWWPLITGFYHYGTGWARLLLLVVTPLLLVVQWVIYGVISHILAKTLGGTGSLSQTLGVTALSMAPRVLLLATAIPFASVGSLLLQVWGILIAYRGLEVAHDLGVRKAAMAALLPILILALISFLIAAMVASLTALAGGGL